MWSRSKYIIDAKLQLKIVALLGLVALLSSLAIVLTLYMHNARVAEFIESTGIPPSAIASEFRNFTSILMVRLVVIIVVMIGTFMFLGFVVTHRIAGPMYRLRKQLQQALAGEEIGQIRFRKDDEFQDILVMINALVDHYRKTTAK